MPAYVLVEIDVTDPETYQTYVALTPPTIAAFGGRFIVRGGANESPEGDWRPNRMVVLEFPNMEQARAWWASPAYTEAKEIRQRSAQTKMLFIEGFNG